MNFGAALKDKLGPFPTWLWLLMITIAGLGWWLIEQRKSSSSTTAADTTGGQADVPEIIIQNQEPGAQSPSGTSPGPGPVISVPPTGKGPTGGGGGPAHYKFITTGKEQIDEDVQEIANSYGMTEAQLVKLNPDLKKYVGSGKTVPSGLRLKVRANLPPIKGPHGKPKGKTPKKAKVQPGGTDVTGGGGRANPGGLDQAA